MNLSSQDKLFFAEKALGGEQDGILARLAAFFEPLFDQQFQELLNIEILTDKANRLYGWKITPQVVGVLTTEFEKKGWIRPILGSGSSKKYEICYVNSNQQRTARDNIEIIAKRIGASLHKYAKSGELLFFHNHSAEELFEIVVEWLLSIDGRDKNLIVREAKSQKEMSAESTFCAQYVQHLHSTKDPILDNLSRLAAVGMVADVVASFRKPSSPKKRGSVIVYLDGPIIFALLGLLGPTQKESMERLVNSLRSNGAAIRVSTLSFHEMRSNLLGFLNTPHAERYGPMAGGPGRQPVSDQLLRKVLDDVESAVEMLGLNVESRRAAAGTVQAISGEDRDRLGEMITWHKVGDKAHEHDLDLIVRSIEERRGVFSRDLFSSRCIVATGNQALADVGQKFEFDLYEADEARIPCCLHLWKLSTLVWLETGFAEGTTELPRLNLLAASERLLEYNRTFTERVARSMDQVSDIDRTQLEFLLTTDRGREFLTSRTFNNADLVDDQSIRSAHEALMAKLESEALKKYKEQKKQFQQEFQSEKTARQSAEFRSKELEYKIQSRRNEDINSIQKKFSFIDKCAKWISIFFTLISSVVFILLLFASARADYVADFIAMKFVPEYTQSEVWRNIFAATLAVVGSLAISRPTVSKVVRRVSRSLLVKLSGPSHKELTELGLQVYATDDEVTVTEVTDEPNSDGADTKTLL